jgi:hypothetical protein
LSRAERVGSNVGWADECPWWSDSSTTQIRTHVLNRGAGAVLSPLDRAVTIQRIRP